MKHFLLITTALLTLCASSRSQTTQSSPQQGETEVRDFQLTAVAPPTPALKYELLFPYADRTPGNAAVPYLDAVLLMAPDSNDKCDKALDAYTNKDMKTFASLADSLDVAPMLEEADVAARREQCDWQSPMREKGERTMLPHLQVLTHGVAKVLWVRALRQIDQGKVDDALVTLRLGYELADKVGTDRVFVSSLVSIGMTRWMNTALMDLMNRPESPNLYWALSNISPRRNILRHSWDAEATWIFICAPRLMRLRAGEELSADDWRKTLVDDMAPFYAMTENYRPAIPPSRPHPDPIKDASPEILRQAQAQYAQRHHATPEQAASADRAIVLGEFYFRTFETASQNIAKLRGLPYPILLIKSREQGEALAKLGKEQPANPFPLLAENLHKPIWTFARTDRQLAALTAVEAIRSYAAANNGSLPNQLDDLTETPAPQNPATGKPFEYKVENNTATLSDSQSEASLTYTIRIRGR